MQVPQTRLTEILGQKSLEQPHMPRKDALYREKHPELALIGSWAHETQPNSPSVEEFVSLLQHKDDPSEFRKLVSKHGGDILADNLGNWPKDRSLLQMAAEYGRTNTVKVIVEPRPCCGFGCDVNSRRSAYLEDGRERATALTVASYYGHHETVKALLDLGADTTLCNARGDDPLKCCRGGEDVWAGKPKAPKLPAFSGHGLQDPFESCYKNVGKEPNHQLTMQYLERSMGGQGGQTGLTAIPGHGQFSPATTYSNNAHYSPQVMRDVRGLVGQGLVDKTLLYWNVDLNEIFEKLGQHELDRRGDMTGNVLEDVLEEGKKLLGEHFERCGERDFFDALTETNFLGQIRKNVFRNLQHLDDGRVEELRQLATTLRDEDFRQAFLSKIRKGRENGPQLKALSHGAVLVAKLPAESGGWSVLSQVSFSSSKYGSNDEKAIKTDPFRCESAPNETGWQTATRALLKESSSLIDLTGTNLAESQAPAEIESATIDIAKFRNNKFRNNNGSFYVVRVEFENPTDLYERFLEDFDHNKENFPAENKEILGVAWESIKLYTRSTIDTPPELMFRISNQMRNLDVLRADDDLESLPALMLRRFEDEAGTFSYRLIRVVPRGGDAGVPRGGDAGVPSGGEGGVDSLTSDFRAAHLQSHDRGTQNRKFGSRPTDFGSSAGSDVSSQNDKSNLPENRGARYYTDRNRRGERDGGNAREVEEWHGDVPSYSVGSRWNGSGGRGDRREDGNGSGGGGGVGSRAGGVDRDRGGYGGGFGARGGYGRDGGRGWGSNYGRGGADGDRNCGGGGRRGGSTRQNGGGFRNDRYSSDWGPSK